MEAKTDLWRRFMIILKNIIGILTDPKNTRMFLLGGIVVLCILLFRQCEETEIAKGEAVAGADPYTSLWPGTSEPSLIQMTCAEVQRFQTQRINSGYASSACGRYQFIKRTLTGAIEILGIDPLTTRYTGDVQDALIIGILKRYRKLNEWLEGSYATDRFMIKLAQEFASMPVPYRLQGQSRIVQKGQSYYAGDGLNRANHDPDTLYQELEEIRLGEPGETTLVDVNSDGPSGAVPETGQSPRTQVARGAAGTSVGAVSGQGRPGSQPILRSELPGGNAVYVYEVIDPLDDRYDFRTGKKVKDILVHGTSAAAASPHSEQNIGASNVAGTNIGVVPPGTDPDLTDPRGRNQIPGTEPSDTTDPLEAFGGAGEDVQSDTDPDASDPRGREQRLTEQNEALEGRAPPAPPPPPTRTPCPEPVSTSGVSTVTEAGNDDNDSRTTSTTEAAASSWRQSGAI